MQWNLPHIVFLLGFQMKSFRERTLCGFVLATGLLIAVYSINIISSMLVHDYFLEARITNANKTLPKTAIIQPLYREERAAHATITTSVYEAKIHWAIPYVPGCPDEILIEATPGHRFVVLDMSFRNITADQEVDMGRIFLTANVQDEQGRVYYPDALVVASLQREYAFPQHEMQYKAMRGVLKPGNVYRTIVYGFEAPVDISDFTLHMEDGGRNQHLLHKAAFSIRH